LTNLDTNFWSSLGSDRFQEYQILRLFRKEALSEEMPKPKSRIEVVIEKDRKKVGVFSEQY